MEKYNRLSSAPLSVKVLITFFLVLVAIGHFVAILQVYSRAQFDHEKTITYFRGNPDDPDTLQLPQSYGAMLSVTHTHVFSQSMLIALVCLLFTQTRLRELTKTGGVLLAFLSSLFSMASPWLIQYVGAGWVWLLEVSGAMLMVSFVSMFFLILRDVWGKAQQSDFAHQ